ncbi:hypothetical protein MIB92_05940 [Aestuariirhabdus sp. Z084]|uniref:hypothetical protein n=1 Tax=Aestuariirhabdus haliotis TaxID=2918751 RepID=UPI00201B446B|nr:hypothetical protein [Aestuariirhabdus haliotis]MCL6415185.1 hypothetical protein [Aestuariirhabdus haliotis]MCL6420060.1 hypothetical protein [Aestuariirhabdus haliotis]
MRHPGIQVICLGLLLLGIVVLPTWLQRQPPDQLLATVNGPCPLNAPCNIHLAGLGDVTLQIEPRGLPHGKPLEISLKTPEGVNSAQLQFVGESMYMGLQPVFLEGNPAQGFHATTRISYCTVDQKMRWLAELRLSTDAGIYQITFALEPLT